MTISHWCDAWTLAFVWIFVFSFLQFFIVTQTHKKIQFRVRRVRNVLKNSRCSLFHVRSFCSESILLAREPYVVFPSQRTVYSNKNILFGTAPKSHSGTRMTDLLLNVQRVKHPETRGLEDLMYIYVYIFLLYSWTPAMNTEIASF